MTTISDYKKFANCWVEAFKPPTTRPQRRLLDQIWEPGKVIRELRPLVKQFSESLDSVATDEPQLRMYQRLYREIEAYRRVRSIVATNRDYGEVVRFLAKARSSFLREARGLETSFLKK